MEYDCRYGELPVMKQSLFQNIKRNDADRFKRDGNIRGHPDQKCQSTDASTLVVPCSASLTCV